MDLRWRHVEGALIELLLVTEEQLGAFRARIRHLKAVGIPTLPKVGSGTQITYTRDHVIQLYLAIVIMDLGVTPKSAAKIVNVIENWPRDKSTIEKQDNDFLAIVPNRSESPSSVMINGEADLISYIRQFPERVFGIVRITDCLRAVDWTMKEKGLL